MVEEKSEPYTAHIGIPNDLRSYESMRPYGIYGVASIGKDETDTLNILLLINNDFCDAVMATFNPRNNFMISKNDGMFDNAVNHKRDTIINANTMIRLSRDFYTPEQLEKIKLAKTIV